VAFRDRRLECSGSFERLENRVGFVVCGHREWLQVDCIGWLYADGWLRRFGPSEETRWRTFG
jgi:hypothetical protein